jgi:putative ABC transport system permease protein
MYETIKHDPGVSLAIPYAVGDNYQGYRIVGTTPDLFTPVERHAGRALTLAGGRVFDTRQREAVVGSYAAQRTGLRVGATFSPYHGLQFDEHSRHRDVFTVVGVLEPTNSPSDRVIWVPLDGIFRMAGHVLRGSGQPVTVEGPGEIPDEYKEVSAVMLRLRDPQAGFALDQHINREGKAATLAWPIARVMAELFEKIGWVDRVLALVAYLVVLVAAASVLASLYNTMNERRREFAILRSLGARRETIVAAVLAEAGAISTLGVLVGYVVYGAILAIAVVTIRNQTGVVLDAFSLDPALLLTPVALVVLGTMAGIVPAIRAYRTDVAANLSPLS